MTRRALLLSASGIAGLGVVKEVRPPAPLGAWRWLDRLVSGFRITVMRDGKEVAKHVGCDRQSYDVAFADCGKRYPLEQGYTHWETIWFVRLEDVPQGELERQVRAINGFDPPHTWTEPRDPAV